MFGNIMGRRILPRSDLHRLLHVPIPTTIQIPPFRKQKLQPFAAHLSLRHHTTTTTTMTTVASSSKVAVVGSGISGSVCASTLARNGLSVTVFESGRGPAGRMSRRRETTEDGKELFFDHGAPYFNVTDNGVMALVTEWEARGLVAEWKDKFGTFDCVSSKFDDVEEEGFSKYVGTPGMNSVCRAMCSEPGVENKFGTTVGNLKWLEDKNLWMLIDLDGQTLGYFDAVVASDKNVVCPRVTAVTGRSPSLDVNLAPELASKLQEIPVLPCFALMLAFPEPLSSFRYQ